MKLSFWKTHTDTAGQVDFSRLPRHIAIILDGNGRWAQRRGLPRTAGHKVGAETFRTIATYCRDIGIQYLTVYAFSTENWRRPHDEVETIMVLLKRYLLEAIDTMERDNVRLRFMGDMTPLTAELRGLVDRCNAISDQLTGCQCKHLHQLRRPRGDRPRGAELCPGLLRRQGQAGGADGGGL